MADVLVLHSAVPKDAPADERDNLVQAEEIGAALARLGHRVEFLAFQPDLESMRRHLMKADPTVVFNLVETIAGSGRFLPLAPALLDHLGLPYTGTGTEALFLSTNKLLAKKLLHLGAIPTPAHCTMDSNSTAAFSPGPWLIKSVWEHASLGLDDDSLIEPSTPAELMKRMALKRTGGDVFAEQFIAGREFNLALLDAGREVQVLPPAEISFVGFPPEKPQIVGYQAKWDPASFEYRHTLRRFPDEASDRELLDTLADLARRCWRLFELCGYARVDFRVDRAGRPWVLEVNANPCLASDAGFMAAATRAGLDLDGVVNRLVEAVLNQRPFRAAPAAAVPPAQPVADVGRSVTIDREDPEFSIRLWVQPEDVTNVGRLVQATGLFSEEETAIAQELVEDHLRRGPAGGYSFVFWERVQDLVGYACYGPIPGTRSSYDLYWIAVAPAFQGRGVGRRLLAETERLIWRQGGTLVYVQTSARSQYKPTRRFYLKNGYRLQAVLKDYYGPGDHQCILAKSRPVPTQSPRPPRLTLPFSCATPENPPCAVRSASSACAAGVE